MLDNIENKAVKAAPSFKGNCAIIVDGNTFIPVAEGEVKEDANEGGLETLTIEQRRALARRGIDVGG